MASQSVPRSTTFEKAIAEFRKDLTQEQKKQFEATTLEELQVTVAAIQKQQASSRTRQYLKRIEGFLEGMRANVGLVEVYLNVNNFVGLVWGPIKFLLQIVWTFSDAFNALLDAYQSIAENMPLFVQYQHLFESNPNMREALTLYFEDLFEFHKRALRFFKTSVWKQMFRATWPNFQTKFGDILKNIQQHKALVERQASLVEFAEAKEARERAERHFKIEDDREKLKRREYLSRWLNSADVISDQEDGQVTRETSKIDGKWLLNKTYMSTWLDFDSDSNPMLWVHGIPGSGKTILASMTIDEIHSRQGSTALFFYCRHGDKQRQSFVAMARSLLHQLMLMDESIMSYLYEEAIAAATPTLDNRSKAKSLLEVSLRAFGKTYIVIDGLDECPAAEQSLMVSCLTEFVDSPSSTSEQSRCVFFSQHDASTRSLLSAFPAIAIRPEDNKSDIDGYCRGWNIKFKARFPGLDDAEFTQYAGIASNSADGMFLFAKLVMKNLYDQTTILRLHSEMNVENFPRGLPSEKLSQAYQRILHRILDPERPAYRDDALKLLAWITCAARPLKWREVIGAVAIDMENETVDMVNGRWNLDHTDLCGPLVEKLPCGRLRMVHQTATDFLISSNILIPKLEHTKLAELCVQYLCLPAFNADMAADACSEYISQGAYTFMEYAMTSWPTHILTALQDESNVDEGGKQSLELEQFTESVDVFLDLHYSEPKKKSKVRKSVLDAVKCLQRPEIQEKLLLTLASLQELTSHEISGAKDFFALSLHTSLESIRRRIEELAHHASTKDSLPEFYGEQVFKCHRLYCDFFHEGFNSRAKRDEHMGRHNRSYYCPHAGCPQARIGCATEKDLQIHLRRAHQLELRDDEFPDLQKKNLKRKNGTHECHICAKKFTRSSNMQAHLRAQHNDEKRFDCSTCGKKFARSGDKNAHEKSHEDSQKRLTCAGPLQNGRQWGCGKAFANASALVQHFDTKTGRKCIRALVLQEQHVGGFSGSRMSAPPLGGLLTPLDKLLGADIELEAVRPALIENYPELELVSWDAAQAVDIGDDNALPGSQGTEQMDSSSD